jgi:diguanylate cyclase (GGDEF)-like protein
MYERVERDKEKLSYEASHDSLTGLLNRNAYNFQLRQLDGKDFCFILLDVDDFKGFNDTYGHDVGDKVLQKISRVLSTNVRSEDLIFRLGGDEFAIVLQGVRNENRDVIEKKMEKIRNDLLKKDDDTPVIRISLGATFSDGKLDMDKKYKEADIALYRAKEEKNKLVFYEDVI